jgi:hypothetical protein
MVLKARANRLAPFRTWHLLKRLNSPCTAPYNIRYWLIGGASKRFFAVKGAGP